MKSLTMKRFLSIFACVVMVLVGGVLLASCGEDRTVTNLSQIGEVVAQSGAAVTDDEDVDNANEVHYVLNVYVSFNAQPSSIRATYNGEEMLLEESSYDNAGVTEYQYLCTLNGESSEEDYNANPVVIRCTINGTTYEFGLTTDFIDRILEASL